MQTVLPSPPVMGFTSGIRIIKQQIDGSYKTAKFCFTESHFDSWIIQHLEEFNFHNPVLQLISELNYDGVVFFNQIYIAIREVYVVAHPSASLQQKASIKALKQSELNHKLKASRKGWSTNF